METLQHQTETKAKKEHKCNFCCDPIRIGEIYMKSVHKYDGEIYDWKTHTNCYKIAKRLKMYDHAEEGVTDEIFQETIHCVHDDILVGMIPDEEVKKYSDIISQLRLVKFRDKLSYVIRYYNKLDRESAF